MCKARCRSSACLRRPVVPSTYDLRSSMSSGSTPRVLTRWLRKSSQLVDAGHEESCEWDCETPLMGRLGCRVIEQVCHAYNEPASALGGPVTWRVVVRERAWSNYKADALQTVVPALEDVDPTWQYVESPAQAPVCLRRLSREAGPSSRFSFRKVAGWNGREEPSSARLRVEMRLWWEQRRESARPSACSPDRSSR